MAPSQLMMLSIVGLLLIFATATYCHVLECYECASLKNSKLQDFDDLKKDPCFDPVAHGMNATKCPAGTSCYKQETILVDVKTGDATLSERFFAISRYCGAYPRFYTGCSKRAGANSIITTCACTTDECNSAQSRQFSSFISTASLLVTVAISTFLY